MCFTVYFYLIDSSVRDQQWILEMKYWRCSTVVIKLLRNEDWIGRRPRCSVGRVGHVERPVGSMSADQFEIIPETTSSWWNPLLESDAKKPRNWPAINPLTKLDKPRTRNRFVSGFMAGQFLGFFASDSNNEFHHDEVVSGIISVFLLFEKSRNQGWEFKQISFTSSRQFEFAVFFHDMLSNFFYFLLHKEQKSCQNHNQHGRLAHSRNF